MLDAAYILQSQGREVQFLLVGGGVERPHLEQRAASLGLTNVQFLPRRPVEEIGALLNRADALLVHLKDDPLFAITIPSRIQAYLAVGRPILCGVRGDGAGLVLEAEAGLCFKPGSHEALAGAVIDLLHLSPEARTAMGERGRCFYQERLSIQVGTRAFSDFFARIQSDRLKGKANGA